MKYFETQPGVRVLPLRSVNQYDSSTFVRVQLSGWGHIPNYIGRSVGYHVGMTRKPCFKAIPRGKLPSGRQWALLALLVVVAGSRPAAAGDEPQADGSWTTVLGGSVRLTGAGDGDIVVPIPADHFELEFEYRIAPPDPRDKEAAGRLAAVAPGGRGRPAGAWLPPRSNACSTRVWQKPP